MNTGHIVLTVGIITVAAVVVYNMFDAPDFRDFPINPKTAAIAEGGFIGLQPYKPPFKADRAAVAVTPKKTSTTSNNIKLSEGHWQGLEALPLTSELKTKLQLPEGIKGLLVDEVTLNAAASGILGGDILTAVNGRKVHSLKDFVRESKRVKNRNSVRLTLVRYGRPVALTLRSTQELGFVQVETAPMILAGAILPHPYRGSCTMCHLIGNTGHVKPDPDGIVLPPPTIRAGMESTHRDRGVCFACHVIVN
ncbi:MAG: hypothetical protein IEMM0002_1352 [bacterium]|nr:MAG: hypothetical protein IEMM0002_1352 [bacterium]